MASILYKGRILELSTGVGEEIRGTVVGDAVGPGKTGVRGMEVEIWLVGELVKSNFS
ncbi:MAG: hypothetical protein ACWGOY_03550 [Anaerolineales bacterium]